MQSLGNTNILSGAGRVAINHHNIDHRGQVYGPGREAFPGNNNLGLENTFNIVQHFNKLHQKEPQFTKNRRRRPLQRAQNNFLAIASETPSSLGEELGTLNALSSSIKNVWSNLFSVSGTEEDDNDGKLRKRIGHGSLRTGASSLAESPSEDPAVVFFPTNQDSECMDGATGGGFNTFGFIAMMLAAYNLIGLVSNNGNQNNDNNINNNNDNNNNNQNVNEATTDTMNMNMGMVILPPLPPGRMLNLTRGTMLENKQLDTARTRHKRESQFRSRDEENVGCFWTKEHHHDSTVVIVEFVKAWIRIVTSFSLGSRIRPDLECGLRALCEANKMAMTSLSDQSEAIIPALDQSEAIVEVGSLVLINALPLGPEDTRDLMMAGRLGRLIGPGAHCRQAYPDCDPGIWDEVIINTSDFTERENK